jgi:hypothetical protein
MTRAGQHIFDGGEQFPSLEFDTVAHGRIYKKQPS